MPIQPYHWQLKSGIKRDKWGIDNFDDPAFKFNQLCLISLCVATENRVKLIDGCIRLVNTMHAAIGFNIHTIWFSLSQKFSKLHKFLNQYQACLYLLECISCGDPKYVHKYQHFNIFPHFCPLYHPVILCTWRLVSTSIQNQKNYLQNSQNFTNC